MTKNILKFKKIILGVVFMMVLLATNTNVLASDLTLDNFTGSGTWEDYILEGTSSLSDGDYSGIWHSGPYSNSWAASVKDGKVTGTFNRDTLPIVDIKGSWSGRSPFSPDVIINNKNQGTQKTTDNKYYLLAPIGEEFTYFDTEQECAFTAYVNILFDILIGICAVIAFLMLVVGGIQYMTSDLISSKEEAKSQATNAILGLMIAVSAWLILNTINPKLLDFCLDKNLQTAYLDSFSVPGAITFDGKPIKVKFNTEAYPGADNASKKTGVETSLILAIFSQETGSGANVGRCNINHPKANMYPEDKVALEKIASGLGKNINEIPVSCALTKQNGAFDGHGGAIGLTQFRPATWLEYRDQAKALLGHEPDPWNPNDALMMTGLYLKKMGGNTLNPNLQKESACKYFGGPGATCAKNAGINAYGSSVMGKKKSIEEQIAKAKKDGKIK